jgi:hypothetical protein
MCDSATLRDYILRFSWKCHELPKVGNADVTSTFWSGTSCQTLVDELSRDQPKTTKELLDMSILHASGEEAVRTVFVQGNGKTVPGGSWGVTPSS